MRNHLPGISNFFDGIYRINWFLILLRQLLSEIEPVRKGEGVDIEIEIKKRKN